MFAVLNPANLGKRIFRLAVTILISMVNVAVGGEPGFMPGDAFFPTYITKTAVEETLAAAKAGEPLTFAYRAPEHEMGSGGWAGFFRMQIRGNQKELAEAIHRIYFSLRTENRRETAETMNSAGEVTETYETNGFLMFVYNRSFDPSEFPLGLKYNESWPTENRGIYSNFLVQQKAVIDDWRFSSRVDGLAAALPDIGERDYRSSGTLSLKAIAEASKKGTEAIKAISGYRILEPVVVEQAATSIIILPQGDVSTYFPCSLVECPRGCEDAGPSPHVFIMLKDGAITSWFYSVENYAYTQRIWTADSGITNEFLNYPSESALDPDE